MKVIEIRNTRQGEVAYILDEDTGRLIKVLVEDLTGFSGYNAERVEEIIEEPIVRRRIPTLRRPKTPVFEEEVVDEETSLAPAKILPMKPPPSIVPPHLAGIFKKPDTPGAAVERRET